MNQLKMLSENAFIVSFGDKIDAQITCVIQSFCTQLTKQNWPWLLEFVPSYHNVCLYVDVMMLSRLTTESTAAFIEKKLEPLLTEQTQELLAGRYIEVPVHYNGPDLAYVAQYHQMSEAEVIARHSQQPLFVHMLGFAPGFAFLGGMDARLVTPRRAEPRLKIEAGAVAIGGAQTAIYPLDTPGGWHIIGYTDMPMFLPHCAQPSRLRVGDRVQFVPL